MTKPDALKRTDFLKMVLHIKKEILKFAQKRIKKSNCMNSVILGMFRFLFKNYLIKITELLTGCCIYVP